MQTNLFVPKKSLYLFPLLLFILFALLPFSSCKNGDKKTGTEKETENATKEFKMNCTILTRAQVQQWVDSGWTKPANTNRIKKILFQFFSSNASSVNNNMQLIAYPGKTIMDIHATGMVTMNIDTTCVAKTIGGGVVFANNSYDFDDLKITNPDGTLNDFDFIRLIPTQNYPPYINFDIEIVRQGKAETLPRRGTDPCPPYCNPESPGSEPPGE